MALQFFSQEERYRADQPGGDPRGAPAARRVADPPSSPAPSASGLRLERRVTPPSAAPAKAVTVELELPGEGNTALWPAPELALAAGRTRVRGSGGRAGQQRRRDASAAVKMFRYLVVPDSAGALTVPAVQLSVLRPRRRPLRRACRPPAASVPVAPGRRPRPRPPRCRRRCCAAVGAHLAWRLVGDGARLGLAAAARAAAARARRARPAAASAAAARAAGARPTCGAPRRSSTRWCWRLVPDPDRRSGSRLAAAVRAAGADAELAARVAAVRERLLARRYGPGARPADRAGPRGRGPRRGRAGSAARCAAGRAGASPRRCAPRGRRRRHARAPRRRRPRRSTPRARFAAAADGFSRRAASEPGDPGALVQSRRHLLPAR